MPRSLRQLFCLLPLLVFGCDRESATPAPKPQVSGGSAVVSGRVTFAGTVPPPRLIELATQQSCHAGAKPIFDDSLVVDADGSLRNVVVYVENGPNVPAESKPAVLNQTSCQYEPHVLAVRAGEPFKIRSTDPTRHNVHAWRSKNKPFNLAYTEAGQEHTVTLAKPEFEPPIEVRCDVHQWMRAYVAVFDHPFYAVTGAGGTFELKNLPAGQYQLVAWHERYGTKRSSVTVGQGGKVSTDFVFGK